jgi:hypothetical protein
VAARLAPPDRDAGLEEIRRRLHRALQAPAGEPGLGRLQRDEDRGAGDGETKSTDSTKIVEHFEKEAKFPLMKTRDGYFRKSDHQMMHEMYTVKAIPAAQLKNEWDIFTSSPPVPGPNEPLRSSRRRATRSSARWLTVTQAQNNNRGRNFETGQNPAVISTGNKRGVDVSVRSPRGPVCSGRKRLTSMVRVCKFAGVIGPTLRSEVFSFCSQ